MNNLPLVVITGPTASGKTGLAIRLAQEYGGEIICADSRTVYKSMDIGTAKPSRDEQAGVPHWGLDLVEPGEYFSAADFKRYAEQKIVDIRARGNIPFLVGGTGLYVDGVLFDYSFGEKADEGRRSELEQKSVEELQEYCVKNNIVLPENKNNKRYLVRAIEQKDAPNRGDLCPRSDAMIVGIATDRDVLRTRIFDRAEQLFEQGVVEEAKLLGKKYGWESEAMTGNIYRLVQRQLQGELTIDEVKDKFTTADWRLAKRQLTWLKRNSFIQWMDLDSAEQYLRQRIVNKS